MIFTSPAYAALFALVFTGYWLARRRVLQNVMLLAASYFFYGFIHPWFCILLAASTLVDYGCALGMVRVPERRRALLVTSIVFNLGLLAVFKYFDFFAQNVHAALALLGLGGSPLSLEILLPVGISFYTFQTMGYTIEVYRGNLEPRRNLVDFALFVAFFPQLVAGPIERARNMLPQIEEPRRWSWAGFGVAWPLVVRGLLKKLVVADNVAPYVEQIFMLETPSALLLLVGSLAFAVQIYADFSAYTDIARGSARALGFELMENFRSPYLAISPADFWRRWHVSFSSWVRDYLYIPLRGSRVAGAPAQTAVLLVTFGLSGLWHGAAWHFVAWGIYHALLVAGYRQLGLGGRWSPTHPASVFAAWAITFALTIAGYAIFRAPSVEWLATTLRVMETGLREDSLVVAVAVLGLVALYSAPLLLLSVLDRFASRKGLLCAAFHGAALVAIAVFAREAGRDFIYFRF